MPRRAPRAEDAQPRHAARPRSLAHRLDAVRVRVRVRANPNPSPNPTPNPNPNPTPTPNQVLEGSMYINGSPQNTFVPGVIELAEK